MVVIPFLNSIRKTSISCDSLKFLKFNEGQTVTALKLSQETLFWRCLNRKVIASGGNFEVREKLSWTYLQLLNSGSMDRAATGDRRIPAAASRNHLRPQTDHR